MARALVPAVLLSGVLAIPQRPAVASGPEWREYMAQRGLVKNRVHGIDVPPDFECGWRNLAYQYAGSIGAWRTPSDGLWQEVWDALELTTLCNGTFTPPTAAGSQPRPESTASVRSRAAATVLYVDAVNGNDGNSGTINSPLQHLPFAVTLARTLPPPATIYLRQGVYRLSSTLTLTPADNGLTISAYNGEQAVVSGGAALSVTWTQARAPTPPQWQVFQSTNCVYGATPNNVTVFNYTRTPDATTCQQVCAGFPGCTAFTWHDSTWPIEYNDTCWLRTDGVWTPVPDNDHTAGRLVPGTPAVYVADVSGQGLPTSFADDFVVSLLYSSDGGMTTQRATRARYPNANPELDQFPIGWNPIGSQSSTYITQPIDMNTTVITVPFPENYPGMFQNYYWGYGAPGSVCATQTPEGSYWCQPNGRTAGQTYFVHTPAGLTFTNNTLPNSPYSSDPTVNGAVIQYWRSAHWFSMMTRVRSYNGANQTIYFGRGQFQGAEGENTGEDWYIEHVFEELDAANEFFFDAANAKLYFAYNGTTPPPSTLTFEIPLLQELIVVNGSIDGSTQVANITLSGLTFTSAAPSFLAQHSIPSGGDWALARVGAVRLQGTVGVVIEDSLFWRVDGHGVVISGYNRNATVTRSTFKWIGESGIASWGTMESGDATAGTQPWFNLITDNVCSELGIWEKQSSCYFQAVTPLTTLARSIFFNGPRAGININDGVGGGTVMYNNLVWNMCRESSDHGAINSWDRVPALTTVLNGTASVWPAYNHIYSNFIVANYESDGGCVDNDDGSSRYYIGVADDGSGGGNVCIYGGHKSDFDGHQKISRGNLHAFANVYGQRCMGLFGIPNPGYNEGYQNNTCILAGSTYLGLSGCDPSHVAQVTVDLGNNRLYAANATAQVQCGSTTFSLAQWQAFGVDVGTTVADIPATPQIIAWAAQLLGLSA